MPPLFKKKGGGVMVGYPPPKKANGNVYHDLAFEDWRERSGMM